MWSAMLAVQMFTVFLEIRATKRPHYASYKVAKSETLKTISLFLPLLKKKWKKNWLLWTSRLDDTNLNMRFVDYGEVNNAQFDRGYSYANMENASFLQ